MTRNVTVVVAVGLAVVLALLLAVLFVHHSRGVPCVDYIPANADCTPDSPAVIRGR